MPRSRVRDPESQTPVLLHEEMAERKKVESHFWLDRKPQWPGADNKDSLTSYRIICGLLLLHSSVSELDNKQLIWNLQFNENSSSLVIAPVRSWKFNVIEKLSHGMVSQFWFVQNSRIIDHSEVEDRTLKIATLFRDSGASYKKGRDFDATLLAHARLLCRSGHLQRWAMEASWHPARRLIGITPHKWGHNKLSHISMPRCLHCWLPSTGMKV